MKKRQTINAKMILGLIALAVMVVIFPFHAGATDCSVLLSNNPEGDPDNDGFTNLQECSGLTSDGSTVFHTIQTCRKTPVPPRNTCIDPESPDLFVVFVKPEATNIPLTNPLEFVANPAASGGLGIYIHEIPGLERLVTATQKAVSISEDLIDDQNILFGNTEYGPPNAGDEAIIFTKRIINFINKTCAGKTECKDVYTGINYSCPSSCSGLHQRYVKNTISHETAHSLNLRNPVDPQNGIHYPPRTTTTIASQTHHLVLGANVYYTDKGGKVAWYIGDAFTNLDRQGMRLE